MGGVRYFLLAGAAVLALACAGVRAQPAAHSAEELKAAYLYHFAAFVEWPAHARANESLVIGFVGAEAVESELRRLIAARPGDGKPVVVRRLSGTGDIGAVHVLYLAPPDGQLARWLAALKQRPVLTVADSPDAMEQGAILNFVVSDRVRFEISTSAAERAGLRLNARLLQVALRLHKGEGFDLPLYAARHAAEARG